MNRVREGEGPEETSADGSAREAAAEKLFPV